MGIREEMPLLARHEGVWDGAYIHCNAADEKIDEHRSRLFCRFPEHGNFPYHRTNHDRADGRSDIRDFPATYADKRAWWDNDLIKGWAAEVVLDQCSRTLMLYWQRQDDPGLYLYEMIQIADDGWSRCRTWHWIRNGQLETRTAIQEKPVSRDGRTIEKEARAV